MVAGETGKTDPIPAPPDDDATEDDTAASDSGDSSDDTKPATRSRPYPGATQKRRKPQELASPEAQPLPLPQQQIQNPIFLQDEEEDKDDEESELPSKSEGEGIFSRIAPLHVDHPIHNTGPSGSDVVRDAINFQNAGLPTEPRRSTPRMSDPKKSEKER